ncbi:MAG: hypothetical protein NTU49_00665, partial [Gammaproteobacteria bacterium]|nr:hypothetical protein [Gammaproteobacteria bacterium]
MDHLFQIGAIALIIGGAILVSSIFRNEMTLSYLSIAVSVCVFGISFITPSAMTFAMKEFETQAGTASAFLGVMQFTIAALFSVIVNMAYGHSIFLIGLLATITGLLALYSKIRCNYER